MKLNEQEVAFFKSLSGTETGKTLVSYYERLISHICDVRNMGKDDTRESVQKAVSIIEEHLISKIKVGTKKKDINPNQHE